VSGTARWRYAVPNLFTAASMLFGLASAALSMRGELEIAAWMILWGTLLDKLDGSAARLLGSSSSFGGQFDSFADFVVFGIAPASLAYGALQAGGTWSGPLGTVLLGVCGAYAVLCATRLARFNISEPPGGDRFFYGAPTTLMGGLVASYYLTVTTNGLTAWLTPLPIFMAIGGVMMVANFRLPKVKRTGHRGYDVFQLTSVVLGYVFAVLMSFPEYLLGIGLFYLFSGGVWCATHPMREARTH
jgi:CDP-diacylglycerol--serine O-phosphatidyltransferase